MTSKGAAHITSPSNQILTNMDRDLPLKPTLAFLACLLLAVVVYIYYAPLTVKPPIGQIYTDAHSRVWVMEKNRLISLEADGVGLPQSISLSQHGIDQHIGQLIPLRSGKFIINAQGQSTSIAHHVKRFRRIAESESTAEAGSLLKCDATFVNCTPWGEKRLFFDVAWSGLELSTGQIILNDTARHRVLLLSADGDILSEAEGFKFPNHAVEDDDKVWIVDTNNYRLVALKINHRQLLKTGEEIDLLDYKGIQPDHNWPSLAALDQQHNWWVMINDINMAHPTVYRLNADKTTTPFGTQLNDASFMLLHNGQVYISQYPENVVWTFRQSDHTSTGKTISNTELTATKHEIQNEISANNREMWLIIAAIAVLGLGLLAYAIKGSSPINMSSLNRHTRHQSQWRINVDQKLDPVASQAQTTEMRWISKNEQTMRGIKRLRLFVMIGACWMFISFAWLFLFFREAFTIELTAFIAASLGVASFAYLWASKIQKIRLGVMGDYLIIHHGDINQATQILGRDILYTDMELYAQDTYLFWQNQRTVLFDKSQFEQYALPIIQQGKRTTTSQLLITRLKNGDMAVITALTLAAFMLVATVLIKS